MHRSGLGRRTAGAAALAALLGAGTAAPATAAGDERIPAPPCITSTSDWRYTFVGNDCSQPYRVQLDYTDGTVSPCRYTAPGDRVTFAGYGTDADYVTDIHLC
ncbi:alpha-amylase [Peterkaempfera sp. SMS 1(5)a]|uniref:alpha-amylase n=1 Tax=Peterkaempfera podocarpi TaxID=3232308 RepID=UPI00366A57A4